MMRGLFRRFSLNIPSIDASLLLSNHPKKYDECKKAVDILHKTGIMILKDPRVNETENDKFLDMMEKYYESRSKTFYAGGKLLESNPEAGYQTGIVEELQERARNHEETIKLHFPNSHPVTPQPPPKDKKWRYMWRVGGKAEVSGHRILPDNKIPADFPEWEQRMDGFGSILMESCYTASEIIAVGLGVPQDTFRSRMEGGTQLLGPTGSDLNRYNKLGDVLAGFHYGRTS
jgi:isopenicillin N synthase-like dioxygenase